MTQPLSDPTQRRSADRSNGARPAALPLSSENGHRARSTVAPASAGSLIAAESVGVDPVLAALRRARSHLLGLQHEPGYWVGELEGDTILESEYILLREFMGWRDEERLRKAANYLRKQQGADGGWRLYPGGPPDVSGSIKAYFALKLAGASPDEPQMRRARTLIRELGGLAHANTFTRIYLALFGQCDWSATPAIPPELVLLPRSFYFNLYEMSSWSRTILVPLSIVCAFRPTVPVPPGRGIEEVQEGLPAPQGFEPTLSFATIHQARSAFRKARTHSRGRRTPEGGRLERSHRREAVFTWRNFFWVVDGALKIAERRPPAALRRKALRAAEGWILARLEHSGGLGAIFPPMVNGLMALRCLGYPDDHPQVVRARRELEAFEIEEGDTLRMQPCFSPVWDTALATMALTEGGLPPDHPALQRAARWLLAKEVRRPGDWSVKNPHTEPGGWYFEFENEFYPDIDDTAAVLMALRRVNLPGKEAAVRRGIAWILSMQGRDGGWASFDRDNNRMVFSQVPFADHNAMLDPSTADITGRVLEMLGSYGYDRTHPAVRRGIDFLLREQEPDGAWYGRWGVNYIYGTWQVLKGLRVVGEDMNAPHVQRAEAWLLAHQNADGGWGETCATYDDPSQRGIGPSTPSQTAWALMGLMAAGDTGSTAVRRGMAYLCATQNAAGTWEETQFTGTGFPKVFYLQYHLYRLYFPIFALGMYARLHEMPGK